MGVKKAFVFIVILLCMTSLHAQNNRVRILTEQELPAAKRGDYIQRAKSFLTEYYGVLHYGIDNLLTQQSLIHDYLMDKSMEYYPEFTPVLDTKASGIGADSYMQELAKGYLELSRTSQLEFRVSDIQSATEFYAPDITSLYIILDYTLELYSSDTRLFKRRCQAYCYFPVAMNFIDVRLMQVKPLHDLVVHNILTKPNLDGTDNGDDWLDTFSFVSKPGFDGRRIVGSNGKYGVVTEDGEIIVPIQYDFIGNGSQSLDKLAWEFNNPIAFKQNNKCGYLDCSGRILVEPVYDSVYYYYLFHYSSVRRNGHFGALAPDGSLVVPAKYDSPVIFPLNENWAHTTLGRKHGFVHRDGKCIIPFEYEQAGDYWNGRVAVIKDGKVGFLDNEGKLTIPCMYKSAWNRKEKLGEYENLYKFSLDGTAIVMVDKGHYQLIDTLNRPLTRYKYEYINAVDNKHSYYQAIKKLKSKDYRDVGVVYLDPYGNEYATPELCKKGKAKIKSQRLVKMFAEAKTHFQNERYHLSFPLFKQLAENEYNLGVFTYLAMSYYWGYGTPKDAEEAFRWYQKAAEKGERVAQYDLSVFYNNGEVVERDEKKAMEWLQKSAENGFETAMYKYAQNLETGNNLVKKDEKAAMAYYEKLSSQGHTRAKVRLARMLWSDRKDIGDYKRAYALFSEAADAGDLEAVEYLGKSHYYGYSVPIDYGKALDYFKKAAPEQPDARYFLGWMHEFGQGCKKDIRAAIEWYSKCSGIRDADERIKKLRK